MKNYIFLNSLMLLFMISCSDGFLDVESKTQSTTGNFYKTESDAYRALIGCYDGWQCTTSDFGSANFYLASEVLSDECFGATGHTDGQNYRVIDRFDRSFSPSDMNIYEQAWKTYYAAIYRCNELITHDEQIEWRSEATRGTYIGECRAIRALCYFDMVRLWGNIPLFTEPVNENREQTNPDDVYSVIFEDLKYAAANIPATAYPKSEASTNDGHITPYAAKALLARVYLYYSGYYGKEPTGCSKAEVLQGLEDFISKADEEGYGLISEYKNLWEPSSSSWAKDGAGYVQTNTFAGDGNMETVLAQKFNYTQDYDGNLDGNRAQVMIGIRNIISAPYGQGWGACTVNPRTVKAFEVGDTRLQASVIDLAGEGVASKDNFLKTHINDQREYTGYTVKKYSPMGEWRKNEASGEWSEVNAVVGLGDGDFQLSQYQDFIVMRYADVLLMAAELGSPNAKTYLNQVRKRAYSANGILYSNYKEVEATLDNIRRERTLEFAFEGQRYWDLLRQGIDNAAAQIAESADVLSGGVADKVVITAEKIKETKGLSQIPYNQITLSNGVLKQNSGW
jgi:hypothetical protein